MKKSIFYSLLMSIMLLLFTACGSSSEVKDADITKPVITLIGEATVTLTVGEVYIEAGATAMDDVDGNITAHIINHNPIDTAIAGTYMVTYDVNDSAGNAAETVSRTVDVAQSVEKVYGEGGTHPTAHYDKVDTNRTTVYYPTDLPEGKKVPVIFFSPGWNSQDNPYRSSQYTSLLTFMASHGYYVIYLRQGWLSGSAIPAYQAMLDENKEHIDTTRIGVVGHSLGGGNTFKILDHFSKEKGYGENGRFNMVIEGWYAWQMDKEDMKTLPSNTNLIMQQYGPRGNNAINDTDPRIVLTQYYLLDSIPNDQKDYQVYEEPDHRYPYGHREYSDMQIILKPLDALMEYTFKGTQGAHDIALEQGNDDPYKQGSEDAIQEVLPIDHYGAKCSDSTEMNALIDYCTMRQFVKIDTNESIVKPAYLASYSEPSFDTNVTRITDRSIQTGNAHPYPKQGTAWNSDGTIIRMQYRLYDAKTFTELPITANLISNSDAYAKLGSPYHGPADIRWSKSDPKVMYVLNSSQQYKKVTLNVDNTDKNESLLVDLSAKGYSDIGTGNNEGNLDYEDKYIVFTARKNADDRSVYIMLYELGQADVAWTEVSQRGFWKEKSDGNPNTNEEPMTFDWVTVEPQAAYIVMSAESKMYRYDMHLQHEAVLADRAEHGDIGINDKGQSVYVQMHSGGNGIWSHNLETLKPTKLLKNNFGGGHITCRNYKYAGWCYVNTSEEGYKEVFAIKLDSGTGVVERLAQTHVDDRVNGCTQINVSPDGKKVLFSTDWSMGSDEDHVWDDEHNKSCSDWNRRVKLDTYQVF